VIICFPSKSRNNICQLNPQ